MLRMSSFTPAPDGFTCLALSKQRLLAGPVVLLTRDQAEAENILAAYGDRMTGIVMTAGAEVRLARLAPLLWRATAPADLLPRIGPLIDGWLEAIQTGDEACQATASASSTAGRVARELAATRSDFNKLTAQLRKQVQELIAAKRELNRLNEELESRVARRTMALANANQHLATTLDELRHAQDVLVRTAGMAGLGVLVAGVAHELNTPIGNALTAATSLAHETSILMATHASGNLRRSSLDQYVAAANAISVVLERNIIRAADIVGHFKQLSISPANETRCTFTLAEVVRNAMAALRSQWRKAGIELQLDLETGIVMESYPRAIVQILTHLTMNAMLHGFEGRDGGHITVRASSSGDDGIALCFLDNGAGIESANLEHIFEPFFTTKFGQGGSGLGLYTVFTQLHKLLGGQVLCTSERGHGTCFHLNIPRVAP